jgi:hypothetical protein
LIAPERANETDYGVLRLMLKIDVSFNEQSSASAPESLRSHKCRTTPLSPAKSITKKQRSLIWRQTQHSIEECAINLVITLEIPVYPYKPTREIRLHCCRAKNQTGFDTETTGLDACTLKFGISSYEKGKTRLFLKIKKKPNFN